MFNLEKVVERQATLIDKQSNQIDKLVTSVENLQQQVMILLPKERAARNNLSPDVLNLRTAGQEFGMKAVCFCEKLRDARILYLHITDRSARNKPTRQYEGRGFFQVQAAQLFVTAAGMDMLRKANDQGYF